MGVEKGGPELGLIGALTTIFLGRGGTDYERVAADYFHRPLYNEIFCPLSRIMSPTNHRQVSSNNNAFSTG